MTTLIVTKFNILKIYGSYSLDCKYGYMDNIISWIWRLWTCGQYCGQVDNIMDMCTILSAECSFLGLNDTLMCTL